MDKRVILNVEGVTKQFIGNQTPAVNQVSFSLTQGELLGLLGPSGCGKTTLLRIIAGFEQANAGKVELAGQCMTGGNSGLPPEKRNTGMVFQDYALFPHLNVADNLAFGLKTKQPRPNRAQIKARVAEVLNLVGLNGLEQRYPHELSGGQQQRVALARALAPQPALILLDEPLSNLDVQVRERLRHEVRSILKSTNTAGIFVTHDQEEAMAIADKIAVMREGKLEQIGTPEQIYSQPASKFVAEFVTQANFVNAKKEGNLWQTELGTWEILTPVTLNSGELMFRQEDVKLEPDERATTIIQEREFLGREYRYCLETPSGKRLHARTNITTQLPVGTKVKLCVSPEATSIFPAASRL
jgi:iron(III) transport system ATP-binding protein